MKSVEVTMTFKVPAFYDFDATSGLVSEIMTQVKTKATDADVVSVVIDEDDEEVE